MEGNKGLSTRVQDLETDDNFNPIPGLQEAPLVSLEAALSAASSDPGLKGKDLSVNLTCAMKFAKKALPKDTYGLTLDEIAAIQLYTQETPLYSILNSRLRDRDRTKLRNIIPFVKLLLSALYKLPPAQRMVYRGVRKNLAPLFPKGDEKTWWAFSSTTCMMEVMENDMFLGTAGERTLFHISACHAYDISAYSAIPSESEYLFPPNTELTVESVFNAGGGLAMVQLKQTPYQFLFGRAPDKEVAPASSSGAAAVSASLAKTQLSPSDPEVTFNENDISSVMSAMKAHPKNASLQFRGCRALQVLGIDDANEAQIGKAGGIELIVAAMRNHPSNPEVQHMGCKALAGTAANTDNKVIMTRAGGHEAAIAALRAHANVADVAIYGCWALSSMAVNSDNQKLIGKAGGVEQVVAAMRTQAKNADVQHRGCRALQNLTVDDDNEATAGRCGGIDILIAAMRNHPTNVDIQHFGCKALSTACVNKDNKVLMGKGGGIPVVVKSMADFPKNWDIQLYGCWALSAAAVDDNNEVIVGKQGGLDAMVTAMRLFPDNVEIQHRGCRGLANACAVAENKTIATKAGAIEAITKAMRSHPTHADVQLYGIWSLNTIGWSSSDLQSKIRAAGTADLVRKAMSSFSSNSQIQEKGKSLLGRI